MDEENGDRAAVSEPGFESMVRVPPRGGVNPSVMEPASPPVVLEGGVGRQGGGLIKEPLVMTVRTSAGGRGLFGRVT